MAARCVPSALVATASWLGCPVCGAELRVQERQLSCPNRHSFDIARQGYVNLLRRAAPANADTGEMVAARNRFLSQGWYQPLTSRVVAELRGAKRVVEVGAGTGHYLGSYLDAVPEALGLATDISPAACRIAARRSDRMGAVVADTWFGLPLISGAVDAVLCVFAPRNPVEFARVLAPGGRLVVVTPTADHLSSLREQLGLLAVEADKLDRLDQALTRFILVSRMELSFDLELPAAAAGDLIAMGPNAFHRHAAAQAAATTAAFTVSVFVLDGGHESSISSCSPTMEGCCNLS